jgi:hypothetical protein
MGVCVEPPEYVIGLRRFDHWVFRTQPEGKPSGPGDLDLTIYGLRKYCRLAAKGSPTVLLLLFVGGDHVVERTPLGEELQALAPAFICRRTGRAFLGYLDDTKYAMHALRIAHQGNELITTGRISLPVREPTRSRLMEVRRGEAPLADVLAELDEQTASLERAVHDSGLPEDADRATIDDFLVGAYRRTWDPANAALLGAPPKIAD